MKDLESWLWAKALASGLIDPEVSEPSAGESYEEDAPTAIWGARIQRCIRQGKIPRERLEAWILEFMADGKSADASFLVLGNETTGAALEGEKPRFEQLQLVGMGGAGRVYKAYDPILQRWVALKYLRWESAQVKEHLLAEARAQAKVKHPHVREVFEVGEWNEEPFIAMRWIEGEPLHRVTPTLGWRAVTSLLIDVCEGVQAAHDQGLLHLDLKPGNILVEGSGQGPLKAFVTDFGLVMDVGRSSDSAPRRGGTLPYASPEQMGEGGHLDARSDVYGLGITLHVALSGRFPHQEVSQKSGVVDRVPEDLMRVARRACAVMPSQRHPTVAALAADLRHVLEGKPIDARRGEWWYRMHLWVRRHPGAAAGLVAGVLAGSSLLAWVGVNRRHFQRQRELALRFGEDTREAISQVRLAHLSPPHDRRAQIADVYSTMDRIEASMASLDESAQGPGHAALGRIHLVLERWDLALNDYEKAWSKGYRTPEIAAQLGMVQGLVYLLERSKEVDLPTGDPARQQTMNALKASSIRFMAQAQAQLSGKELPPGLPVMQAEVEDRIEDAKRLGWKALEVGPRDPWHYEPLRLAMEVWDDRVQRLIVARRFEEAESWLVLQEATLAKALEVGRSDPNLYSLQGYTAFDRAHLLEIRGQDPISHLRRAVESFRMARELDPSLLAPIRWGADALRRIAEIRAAKGQEVLESLDEAARLVEPIIDPKLPNRPWRNRYILIRILSMRALEKHRLGRDARSDMERAQDLLASMPTAQSSGELFSARVLPLEMAQAWQAQKEHRLSPGMVVKLSQALDENAPSSMGGGYLPLGSQATRRMALQFKRESAHLLALEWREAWNAFDAALNKYVSKARPGGPRKDL